MSLMRNKKAHFIIKKKRPTILYSICNCLLYFATTQISVAAILFGC